MPLSHAFPTTARPDRRLAGPTPALALAARATRLLGSMALAGGCALAAQAQSLTELHGGTLEIESVLGKGTTVRIFLPAWRLRDAAAGGAIPGSQAR